MGKLENEIKEWNTPLVGAYLLWCFAQSFVKNHSHSDSPTVIEIIIAFTLLTNNVYSENINGHRPNFASYVRSFTENKRSDLLACLSDKLQEQKTLAMAAVDIAVGTGLLAWDYDSAKLFPCDSFKLKRGSSQKGMSVQALKSKAITLGKWFSQVSINTIVASLGVIL